MRGREGEQEGGREGGREEREGGRRGRGGGREMEIRLLCRGGSESLWMTL